MTRCFTLSASFLIIVGASFVWKQVGGVECTSPLGMEDNRIPDSALTASSEWNSNHGATNARLNKTSGGVGKPGSWSAKVDQQGQYLQIDLGRIATVTKVATQGRQDHYQWVTKYMVSYSKDGHNFLYQAKVYWGNADRNTVVVKDLIQPIEARFVRIYAVEWHDHISMRVELYGCYRPPEPCLTKMFGNQDSNKALVNHVISTPSVTSAEMCEIQCFIETTCESYNYGVTNTGSHVCELSDSDAIRDPLDWTTRQGFVYCGTKNPCITAQCPSNSRCHSDFENDTHKCVCLPGFTGINCDIDVNECSRTKQTCHVNASCNNTLGSYNCFCNEGFQGDGITCQDMDECSEASHGCHVNASCINIEGFYNCLCKEGFYGDGIDCTDIKECYDYIVLDEPDRARGNQDLSQVKCDITLQPGWYRFKGESGDRIPEACVPMNRCGTHGPGWMNGSHPTAEEGAMTLEVCYHWFNNCCWRRNNIRVRKCHGYYVYELARPPLCNLRYCGNNEDECSQGSHGCHVNASCVNTEGSYNCSCKEGFHGDGFNCTAIKGYTPENPAKTCAEALNYTATLPSGGYYLDMENGKVQQTYCHMTDIPGCGGGGWTLVMKINGNLETFNYSSHYWSDKLSFSVNGGVTGFDLQETKLPSYWSTPFTKLCLGMRVGDKTGWIAVNYNASSLYSLLADGAYRSTSLGRDAWKSLIDDSSLQYNCNMEGFNVNASTTQSAYGAIARIGIIANDDNHCLECDSIIGFGTAGQNFNRGNSCGNKAYYNPDAGDKNTEAHCYILVQ